MKYSLITIFFTFFVSFSLLANEPKIDAAIVEDEVYVGDSVTMTLTLRGVDENWMIDEEQFNDFDVQVGAKQSFISTTIINGSIAKDEGFKVNVVLTPKKSGSYSWTSIKIKSNNKIYESRAAISLLVKEIAKQPHVLLFITTKDQEVFLQQVFEVRIRILIEAFDSPYETIEPIIPRNVPEITIPWLENIKGFKKEDLQKNLSKLLTDETGFHINNYKLESGIFSSSQAKFSLSRQLIKHRAYDGVTRDYHEYSLKLKYQPLNVGEYEFSPISFNGSVPLEISKRQNQLAVSSHKDIRAISNSLKIKVREVPLFNRPLSYVGAIGQFSIATHVDRNNIQVGEPIIFNIEISGKGLLEPITMPNIKSIPELSNNFKIYIDNPDGKIANGKKIFQATCRPLNADINKIPQVPFSFFDIHQKKYIEIFSDEIKLQVQGVKKMGADDVVANIKKNHELEGGLLKSEGMVEFLTSNQILAMEAKNGVALKLIKWLNLILGTGMILFFFFTKLSSKQDDEKIKISKMAVSQAEIKVKQLNLTDNSGLSELGVILLKCVADKFMKPSVGYTRADFEVDVKKKGISEKVQMEILEILNLSEQSRFGGGVNTEDVHIIQNKLKTVFEELKKI